MVSKIYNGQDCHGKYITTDGGIASGIGFSNGDIVTVRLDFNEMKILFLKNGNQMKQANLEQGKTYYPTIQICACSNGGFSFTDLELTESHRQKENLCALFL